MLDLQSGWHPLCWKCWVIVPVLPWNPSPPLLRRVFGLLKLIGLQPGRYHLCFCCDAQTTLFTDLVTNMLVLFLWSLLIRLLFQNTLNLKNCLILVPLVLVTVYECVCLFWILRRTGKFSSCLTWSFLSSDCEAEPLERTEKNSSCLAVRNHLGWRFVKEHSLLTGSDINIQEWIDSMQDISLLGTVKQTWLLSFFCTVSVKACPTTSFVPSLR